VTNQDNDLYADDPAHPISRIDGLDMIGKRRDGGVELRIKVSGPLKGDERSQRRLLQKIDLYLAFVASPDFEAEFGEPDVSKTFVVVAIDGQSDPAIFELLKRCEAWVREGKATLVVEKR
jgi:hypothetical protein